MITDDLAGLFQPPDDDPPVKFRQGIVVAFNTSTGQNTIQVAGGNLDDVPMLNTGEAIALKPGHIVGLLLSGKKWFIIGRITPANDPNFASASLAFASDTTLVSNFQITPAKVTRGQVVLPVPSWADQAAVIAVSNVTGLNPLGVPDFLRIWTRIDGVAGAENIQGMGSGSGTDGQYFQCLSSSAGGVITPGATITIDTQVSVNGASTWAAQPQNSASVIALAIFRSVA